MLIGYARVSTDDQHLDLQCDALMLVGCERIFEDKVSGAQAEREGLARLNNSLRPGDTVVIWRLDRLGRSLKNLLQLVERLTDCRWAYAAFRKILIPRPVAAAWFSIFLVHWRSSSAIWYVNAPRLVYRPPVCGDVRADDQLCSVRRKKHWR